MGRNGFICSEALKKVRCFFLVLAFWAVMLAGGMGGADSSPASPMGSGLQKRLKPLIGPNDAIVVRDPHGRVLADLNGSRLLIPASILKVLTGLTALHHLGADYRYPTDFYMDKSGSLKIKGYGDPFLVSERIAETAHHIAGQIKRVKHLILDASYFADPIHIPGRHRSIEPYDAPNGALCVNFNTVNFMRKNGQWVSAEPQTPLLPSVIPKIKASGLSTGRITLAAGNSESLMYAGEMFQYFLTQAGITISGSIMPGTVDPQVDRLLWRYRSQVTLKEIIAALLAYSNNFIANQLLLTMGAKQAGPPATVDKGLSVLRDFYRNQLSIASGSIVEASGISRENRITAQAFMMILERFEPYHALMRKQGRQFYKTGTLSGIRTRAGYLIGPNGELYPFVVMLNTRGKTTAPVMRALEEILK
jgi:D-alanyl-D-alanine carboxypeptidase/D-alanyl-D-alanine-endopeptidase (penicillin-binding protein 4)